MYSHALTCSFPPIPSRNPCAAQVNASLERIVGQNDAAAKRLSGELFVRLTHADIEEIFQSGLHEYLTDCLDDINELGSRMQRAYLGTV